MASKRRSVGLSTSQAPARPNRAARRGRGPVAKTMKEAQALYEAGLRQVAILPGLPGSLYDYVSQAAKEAFAEQHLDALAALHPGMVWRAENFERLGIPSIAPIRVRHVTAEAPDGLGRGIVLGELTTEPEERRRVILPHEHHVWPAEGGPLQMLAQLPHDRAKNAAAAARFLKEHGDG